jgi:RimJ/RimL family protein N-acetyltransferase
MRRSAIITTKRLRLRNWQLGDVASYNAHCNTAAVMEYLGGVVPSRSVRAEVRWYQSHQERYGFTYWALERKRDNMLLGFSGIIVVPDPDSPLRGKLEIGWRMRADQWRRGYSYEAAAALIEWAEWERPGETLYARIHGHNAASQALARKLGMRRARALEARQRGADKELWMFKLPL